MEDFYANFRSPFCKLTLREVQEPKEEEIQRDQKNETFQFSITESGAMINTLWVNLEWKSADR